MKLTRKIHKLLTGDALRSLLEHARRWTHPVDVRAMHARLDPAAWADLRRRYLGDEARGPHVPSGARNSAKFADADYWLKINAARAQDLRLDRCPPLRVLDLGCGAGWFVYVCRCLGHDAEGLDIDEDPLFRETTALLGVRRTVARIEPFEPLPEFAEPFDFIASHCICFHKLAPDADGDRAGYRQWGTDAWAFFLRDVRTRLLTQGGRLLLDFNPRGDNVFYPPEVGELFRAEGARFFRSKVLLTRDGSRPERFAAAEGARAAGHPASRYEHGAALPGNGA